MAKYRNALPQLLGQQFLTDGGIETTLIFHDGLDLPHLAAIDLMRTPEGRSRLREYFARYAQIALDAGAGFIFESPTWRASRDWADRIGYSRAQLADMTSQSIELMAELRTALETERSPMVLSGCVGPRGDGYVPGRTMSADEAEAYHAEQIAVFHATESDMVAAITMNYIEEAIGVARAAAAAGLPSAISFTLETDGRLPTGQTLKEAIEAVDADTDGAPAYFMINCAHPTHFADALTTGEAWTSRIRGLRANASKRSHAELDEAPDLDAGDPLELARDYRELIGRLSHLTVLGGCCGTDHRHVEAIARSCVTDRPPTADAA